MLLAQIEREIIIQRNRRQETHRPRYLQWIFWPPRLQIRSKLPPQLASSFLIAAVHLASD